MKKITMIALAMFTTVGAGAQTIYDATNIAQKELNGTARFVGMGGAMGALGGDISTIGTNPAGIGIYRSNDAMLTFGYSMTPPSLCPRSWKRRTSTWRGNQGQAVADSGVLIMPVL